MINMTTTQHIEQAEMLLREAAQDLATAQSQWEYRRVKQMVQMAQAHAQLATAKRWAKPS